MPCSTAIGTAADVRSNAVQLSVAAATTIAAAVAAGAAIGYWAGLRTRANRRRDTVFDRALCERMCECGTRLPWGLTEEERLLHKASSRHKRNMIGLSVLPQLIICEEIGEYRAAGQQLLNQEDAVLEVGCHVGGTTRVLAAHAGVVVGLDQQPMLIGQARQRLPNIHFEIGDAFDAKLIMSLSQAVAPRRFTKIFVDISGSRHITTVLKLITLLRNTLHPELMVLKSQHLKRFMLRSQLWVDHPQFREVTGGQEARSNPRRRLHRQREREKIGTDSCAYQPDNETTSHGGKYVDEDDDATLVP